MPPPASPAIRRAGGTRSPTRPAWRPPMRETAPILAQKFEHAAVFYGSTAEYLDAVLGFVAGGLERADPVLVAVPGPKVGLLRDHLGDPHHRGTVRGDPARGADQPGVRRRGREHPVPL